MFGKKKNVKSKKNTHLEKTEYKHIVEIENLKHDFVDTDEEGREIERFRAVDDVSLQVGQGDFIAILGHNGSGKSTLAKHINAILMPTEGTLYVAGMNTKDEEKRWRIRQNAGMVFQNPDNQIIATIVEEDVGFGPENMGIPTEDIWKRVDKALETVGMTDYRHHSPAKLSGGQKQRVAIAGVMAMKPKCIVLDEPTAMLDPNGRKEVVRTLKELNKKEGVTIILITHYMDEVIDADRVFVMDNGRIALSGTPREVFSKVDKIKELGLDVPQVTEIAKVLRRKGAKFDACVLTIDEFVEQYKENISIKNKENTKPLSRETDDGKNKSEETKSENDILADNKEETEISNKPNSKLISIENINYTYSKDTAFKKDALKNINLDIYEGQFIAVIGHTGSGKSTLIQHLNGILKAESGRILYRGKNIYDDDFKMPALRKKVGLVFQYPEYQLFEATVIEDVAYGPKNLGLSKEEAREKAKQALEQVGVAEKLWDKSPFELSGGQKRRVAIAGILAMEPEVLILDEPTAALDPRGRDKILKLINTLHKEYKKTIILVSHSMEDVAKYADRIIVMNKGQVKYDGAPTEVFRYYRELENIGLAAPQVTYLMARLREEGIDADIDANTVKKAISQLEKRMDLSDENKIKAEVCEDV